MKFKNVLIYGYGLSGKAVERVLLELNIVYSVLDKNFDTNYDRFYKKITKKQLQQFDLIVISPGISVYDKIISWAKKLNIKVIGELEFGSYFMSGHSIGVTGTNGKTSTVELIHHIICENKNAEKLGNIATPLSTVFNKNIEEYIIEISSFQLETIELFKVDIGVLLNIAENHLDRHITMENYIQAKLNLFKNNNENNIVILNFDDPEIFKRIDQIRGNKFFVSRSQKVKGIYIENDKIIVNILEPIVLCNIVDLSFNLSYLYDYLVAILVAKLLQIDSDTIIKKINSFKVSNNRQEVVTKYKGVTFINDSKATNTHSVINCLNAYKDNIILLLGGIDKHISFDDIFIQNSKKLKLVIAFGKCRNKILKTAKKNKFYNIKCVKKMGEAVSLGFNKSIRNDYVILSPACSSFDEFKNYKERGEMFKKYVWELIENDKFKN